MFAVADQIGQERPGPAHQVGGNPWPVQGPVGVVVAYGQLSLAGAEEIAWTDPAVTLYGERMADSVRDLASGPVEPVLDAAAERRGDPRAHRHRRRPEPGHDDRNHDKA